MKEMTDKEFTDSLVKKVAVMELQIDKMCRMLDGVTTQVSKTSTVHALSCISIDDFLETEFKFFTKKKQIT